MDISRDIQEQGCRIKMLRKKLNLTQKEFGQRILLERSTISLIECGERNVTDRIARDICREFKVSYHWLMDGKGKIDDYSGNDFEDMIADLLSGENETAKTVFRAFAQLDASDWAVIQKVIDGLRK